MIYLSAADIKAANQRRRGLSAVPTPAPALIPPLPELRIALERKRARAAVLGSQRGPRVLLAAGTTGWVTLSPEPPGTTSPALRRLGQRLDAHRLRDRCTDCDCACQR